MGEGVYRFERENEFYYKKPTVSRLFSATDLLGF